MLGDARLYANLTASDLDRAIEFYERKLGLRVLERREVLPGHEEALFDAGGAVICIEAGGAPAPSGKTPIAFEVDEIDEVVAGLAERGVAFEEYDLPAFKTENGIARVGSLRAAWFKDPDGNLLGLLSAVPAVAVVS